MKRLVIAIASIAMFLGSADAFAQKGPKYGATPEDSMKCVQYLSYYKEYYKQKSYKEATPNWREAYHYCLPTANQNMIVDGTALVRRLIDANSKNPVYRDQLIDTLLTLHDLRIQYYPKYAVTARNNKGLDMTKYIKDDNKTLYNGLNSIIEDNQTETKVSLYIFNLNAAIELYRVGVIDEEEVISVYERNYELLANTPAKNDAEKDLNAKIKADLENLFVTSKVADCDKLQELFTPRYDADPNNAELAQKIVKIMSSAEDCLDNRLFISAATTVYNSNPTSEAAYMLYKLNSATANVDLAMKYLNEAVANTEVVEEKANYMYELAVYSYKSGRQLPAVDAAKKAAATTSDAVLKGKCYMILGNIWAAVRCQGNEIASRAQYWVATDYFELAMKSDPSLTDEARGMIGKIRQYYPATADAFMYGVNNGESYEVSCNGFHAVTTVRTQK